MIAWIHGVGEPTFPARGENGRKMPPDSVHGMGTGGFSPLQDEDVKPSPTKNSSLASLVLSDVLSYDEPAHLITWLNI